MFAPILLLALTAVAQEPPQTAKPDAGKDWESLSVIQPGTKIDVRREDGTRVKGVFSAISASGLTVAAPGGSAVTVPRFQVVTVSATRSGVRGRRALIGGFIGAAALGGLFALACGSSNSSCEVPAAAMGAGGALIGGGIGLAVGAALPVRPAVYRFPRGERR